MPDESVRSYQSYHPQLGERVYIDPAAVVIGDVHLGADSSVWPCAVIRGDMHRIRVGARTSIQDNSVLHITHASDYNPDGYPLTVGDEVTVGHSVTLHGCTLGNRILVGIGSTVLNRAKIGKNCIIGAHSLIPEGKEIPDNSLVMGSPGKVVRQISDDQVALIKGSAQVYVDNWKRFKAGLKPIPG